MLWLTSIVLAFGESPFGRALNLCVLPLFAGLLLSQPARDLQSLSLSWTLPNLRRRLLPPLIAIQGLLALGCAVWVDHGLAFWPAFGLAMAFCSMGSSMNTDQSSLIELQFNLSLATWALAFVALLRFDLLMSAATEQPIITTVVCLLVAAFYFGVLTARRTHRMLIHSSFFSLVNSLNPSALMAHRKRVRSQRWQTRTVNLDAVTAKPTAGSYLQVGFLDSFGHLGIARLMIKLILITSAMILLMGVLFPGDWGLMIPIWIYVFAYQFPLRVRSDLPRPISRSYLSHANLWCVFSETAIFMLVVAALLNLFVLTPLPPIALSEQLTLVYQTPTQWHLWLAGTVCWLPWVQYLRRRYGFKVRQYILIMATAYLVTAGTVWTLAEAMDNLSAELRVSVITVSCLLNMALLILLLRRVYLNRDLTYSGC